ncbi:MAG: response regulator, partial [candidate division Zixibacteria bacterium]|nr:response regulator [candidate division Zixibacteria bacterium]
AENGHEAINYLKNNNIDLLVIDMIMEKGFDGLDTYKEVLKIHTAQKAVIMSGYSPTKRVEKMQELGAGKYIKKPFSRDTLGRIIREELDRKLINSN